MKLLKRRGSDVRLQCHCGKKFWADLTKEKNPPKCPKCKCLVTAQDEVGAVVQPVRVAVNVPVFVAPDATVPE